MQKFSEFPNPYSHTRGELREALENFEQSKFFYVTRHEVVTDVGQEP